MVPMLYRPCAYIYKVSAFGVVGVGYFVVALCFGQVEELLCGIGGNKLKGFYVGFLGFAITDRFDAPVPLQAVVAKQGLAVSDVDG